MNGKNNKKLFKEQQEQIGYYLGDLFAEDESLDYLTMTKFISASRAVSELQKMDLDTFALKFDDYKRLVKQELNTYRKAVKERLKNA